MIGQQKFLENIFFRQNTHIFDQLTLYLNMHEQLADPIIFENIANQRQIKFCNARKKKTSQPLGLFFRSKCVTLTKEQIYRWKILWLLNSYKI